MIKLLLKLLFYRRANLALSSAPTLDPEPDPVLKNMINSLKISQKFESTTPVKCCSYVFSVQYRALSSLSLLMHLQPMIGKSMLVACLEFLVSV